MSAVVLAAREFMSIAKSTVVNKHMASMGDLLARRGSERHGHEREGTALMR